MANFLTFEENQVLINNKLFPANSISLQLNANTVPVKDIYGNILYYSPNGPIQGTVGLNFFLTGALPSYFRLENQDESPIKVAFNTILIPDCYLTNLSFSVRPFEPIPVKADLVFYHGIKAMNTDPIVLNAFATNIVPKGIASTTDLFTSNLKTLNGTASYILTDNRSSWPQNPTDFVVTDFDYQFSVERVPILRVGDTFPTRVAMKEANAEFSITTNNLDGYLDIHGNTAEFSAVLRDSTSLSTYDNINLTGIIVDQSYEISEDNYGLSKIKMIQALNRKRSLVTIPMEVSDPNIVNPPTKNIINPPNTPVTTTITQEIKEEEPKPQDPEKGTTTTPTPEIDTTVWYYITVVVQTTMLNAHNAGGCANMKIGSIPKFSNYNFNGMKFQVLNTSFNVEYKNNNKYETNTGADIKYEWNYSALGSILSLRVNEEFLTNFLSSDDYINNSNNIFIEYSNIACNPLLLQSETSSVEQKYSSFFRSEFFSAYNDIYKGDAGKLNPFIFNISIVPPNNDGGLYAIYNDSK